MQFGGYLYKEKKKQTNQIKIKQTTRIADTKTPIINHTYYNQLKKRKRIPNTKKNKKKNNLKNM